MPRFGVSLFVFNRNCSETNRKLQHFIPTTVVPSVEQFSVGPVSY
jgi:hypothetical protein